MDGDIENTVKIVQHVLVFSRYSQKKKRVPQEILGKAWKVIGAGLLTINKSNFTCVVDYYKKGPHSQKGRKNYQ